MLIEAAGCDVWLLPCFSPNRNPIEPAFRAITAADYRGSFAAAGNPLRSRLLQTALKSEVTRGVGDQDGE